MTREERRWIARIIRESARFYGHGSGGILRRTLPGGTLLARQVACYLLVDVGYSYDEVGKMMRMYPCQVQDVLTRLLPALMRRNTAIKREISEIRFQVDVMEMGFEAATF